MHGEGARRKCPECGQSVTHIQDSLSVLELRGPRNITSSNVDRIFDDGGRRFLVIEEKRDKEHLSRGQHGLLTALVKIPQFTVWVARGNPQNLQVTDFGGDDLPFLENANFGDYQAAVTSWYQRGSVRSAS